jgi:anaerobic selenocysteine-containing dehydrogenase
VLPAAGSAGRRPAQACGAFSPSRKGWNAVEALEAAERGELSVLWAAGGNFLETLPEPGTVRRALGRVPFRVHQDIVLTSQMLVEPAEEVLLLPATTRYEMPGGGTETSTERRIWFSPEVAGPRIPEARPEWQVLYDVVSRARPDRAEALRSSGTAALREEIAKAQPLYAGIEKLERKGDVVQWGGRLLGEESFATSHGKANFQPVAPPERALPENGFFVSTRRGKQFNSMVHKDRDPLNGVPRDVLMSPADASRLGLEDGDEVELARGDVRYRGRVKLAAIRPGNLQVHWPEGNVLVPRRAADPESGTPDYNAVVTVSFGPPGPETPPAR